jgi:hypothetical protein
MACSGSARDHALTKGLVMPGLVPGIHVFLLATLQDVDGRDKPGHDGRRSFASLKPQLWQWRAAVPKLRKSLNFA